MNTLPVLMSQLCFFLEVFYLCTSFFLNAWIDFDILTGKEQR